LLDNGAEFSKIGEQIFTMKKELVDRPSVMTDGLVQSAELTKKYVKDIASKYQKFRVNFHRFHALFSTKLSQLG
jgi:hypothetical protein